MRSKLAILMALALVLTVTVGPGVAASDGTSSSEANEEQTGRTAWCTMSLEWMVLDVPPVSELRRDTPGTVAVDPGTDYRVSAEDGSRVVVTFFDDGGEKLSSLVGDATAPADAAWGKVCVELPVPFGPVNPTTTWQYQDGF